MASQPQFLADIAEPPPLADRSASQAYEQWMAANPAARPVHSHPWDVSRSDIYIAHSWQPLFAQMRAQAPVNKVIGSPYGDFWNVTTAAAIREVEAQSALFSSSFERGGIALSEPPAIGDDVATMPMFIAMDGEPHRARRQAISPVFTPAEMIRMAQDIRKRTAAVLDALPLDCQFDWVERVSVELTAGTLARLLGMPWDDRHKLTGWSDWASDLECMLVPELFLRRRAEMHQMAHYFGALWLDQCDAPRGTGNGLSQNTSMLAMLMDAQAIHGSPEEFLGNMMLMVVAGSDTTRNAMSGLVHALDLFPDQRALLENDPALIANAVHETIRYVTPIAHMRRTATRDTRLAGQDIAAGDKLALWYISANRDETLFADPDRFDLQRENARHHLSFGHGAHRCVGARLAELQLKILIEELLERRLRVRVSGRAQRVRGNFAHGFHKLEVELTRF